MFFPNDTVTESIQPSDVTSLFAWYRIYTLDRRIPLQKFSTAGNIWIMNECRFKEDTLLKI